MSSDRGVDGAVASSLNRTVDEPESITNGASSKSQHQNHEEDASVSSPKKLGKQPPPLQEEILLLAAGIGIIVPRVKPRTSSYDRRKDAIDNSPEFSLMSNL